MTLEIKIILILIILTILLFYLWRKSNQSLRDVYFQKKSLASKYGKMTEQFMPFLSNYPYDPQNFRFIGTPIDGIQFENDKIIFIEFKTAGSHFSPRQQSIRQSIIAKKISFEEIRLK